MLGRGYSSVGVLFAGSVLVVSFGCGGERAGDDAASAGGRSGSSGGAPGASSGGGPARAAGSPGAGGASAEVASEWTMLGYDAASTYNNTAETKISRDSVSRLREFLTLGLRFPGLDAGRAVALRTRCTSGLSR